MKTKVCGPSKENIIEAGRLIREGHLVGIPTETVYGLGADATNGKAVSGIFEAKGRPQDNPLIVHIWDFSQVYELCVDVPNTALALAEKFWPGPLTIIMKKSGVIPNEVSAGLDTVGIRMPSHKVARDIIKESGVPIAAPSANISGRPSPTKAAHVYGDLAGKIPLIIDGGECEVGVESTVVTLAEGTPVLLRPGGITLEELRTVLPDIKVHPAVTDKLEEGTKVSSPGMKYKHYAPKAQIVLLDGSSEKYIEYVNSNTDENTVALCFDNEISKIKGKTMPMGSPGDTKMHAHKLFSALRQVDEYGFETGYAHLPKEDGMGLAVYNRLIRAAGYKTVKL